MSVKASDIKKLREQTGAGMMDCKKALTEAEGDFNKAVKLLKEMGLATAQKKSGRATKEGSIFTKIDGNKAVILEIACETDFVARNEDFKALGQSVINKIFADGLTEINDELNQMATEAVATIKENIAIKRLEVIDIADTDVVVDYIHGDGGIGVLVKLSLDKADCTSDEKVKTFAFDCALHAAAFSPMYLNRDDVDADYLKEQEEIFTKQADNLDKPDNVKVGIVKGKVNKHLASICFVDQPFVKDDKLSVAKAGDAVGKEVGCKITLADYKYYSVGGSEA